MGPRISLICIGRMDGRDCSGVYEIDRWLLQAGLILFDDIIKFVFENMMVMVAILAAAFYLMQMDRMDLLKLLGYG